jgi:hypothetical protein
MTKETTSFIVQLLFFTAILFGIHHYILSQFFAGELYFPIWTIYVFNVVLVLVVFFVLRYISKKNNNKTLQFFLGLTTLKMGLAIVFLLPLFLGKSNHAQLEIINFFVPYFLFLTFEIFSLNKFLQKS